MYIYMCVYTYIHTYIYTHIHAYLCVCVYMYVYILIYEYIYVCLCVNIYIYIAAHGSTPQQKETKRNATRDRSAQCQTGGASCPRKSAPGLRRVKGVRAATNEPHWVNSLCSGT